MVLEWKVSPETEICSVHTRVELELLSWPEEGVLNSALSSQEGRRVLYKAPGPVETAFHSSSVGFLLLHPPSSTALWFSPEEPMRSPPRAWGKQGGISKNSQADCLVVTSFRLQQKLPVCPQILIRLCPSDPHG